MQSAHCQTRVSNAVKHIEGVQIEKVEAGKLTVLLISDSIKSELENTIIKAGYTISFIDEGTTAS